MKLKDKQGAGFRLGDFYVAPNGEEQKPNNLTAHQEKILAGWIKSGIVEEIVTVKPKKKKVRD